jgi:hypothetical protein
MKLFKNILIKNNIFKNVYFIILILLFIIYISYTFYKKNIENYENQNNITIVIARYKEDISYLLNDEFKNYTIIIYNKGDEITNQEIINKFNIVQLPNVGKCDHTYLHHIIENYDNLSNVTIFLPASFYFMDYKKNRGLKVIEKASEINNTIFPVTNIGGSVLEIDYVNNFELDEWKTSFGNNQDKNANYKTKLSPIRPYGKWYEKHFPNNKCPYISYMGMFAISKNDIHKNQLEKYKTLISYMDDDVNPEAGHFMERAWVSLFYPINESSIYTDF